MIKSPIRVIENIGCYCSEENGDFIIGQSLDGYVTLSVNDNNTYIPYICKSADTKTWEIGIGLIQVAGNKVVVRRNKIIKKSTNEVQFTGTNNRFFVFANEHNFNVALNNCIVIESDRVLDNIRATYIVDGSDQVVCSLPSAKENQGLCIDFKNVSSNITTIKDNNKRFYCDKNSYIKLISNGIEWVELFATNPSAVSYGIQSTSNTFTTQSVAAFGYEGSLQYNNNNTLDGSEIIINSGLLLVGNNNGNPIDSQNIVPLSAHKDIVFNNTNGSGNFIAKGLANKNMIFTADGKLGINMPSGIMPQTSLHIVNHGCQEGLRLENRNSCYPANLTLYHKPTTLPPSGSIISTINLSCKNQSNVQINYSQLRSKAISYDSSYSSGELALAIQKNGSLFEALRINPTGFLVSVNNNSISITDNYISLNGPVRLSQTAPSGSILMSDDNGNLILTSIVNSSIMNVIDGQIVSFTGVCT